MNDGKPTRAKGDPSARTSAETILLSFCLFYVVFNLLLCLCLPLTGSLRTFWYTFQLGVSAAGLVGWLVLFLRRTDASAPHGREILRGLVRRDTAALLLWVLWAGAACLMAVGAGIASLRQNVPYLFDLFVSLLVLYPLGLYLGEKRDFRLLSALIDTGAAIFTGFSLLALICFFSGMGAFTVLGHSFGINSMGRLAVGSNPNTTGALCAFFLAALLFRLYASPSRLRKWLYGLSVGVNLVTLYLSDCRTSYIAFVITSAAFVFALLYRRSASRRVHTLLIVGALLLAGAAAALAYYLFVHLGLWSSGVRGGSILSLGSRTRIWQVVIQELKTNRSLALRGCSPASTISYIHDLATFKSDVYTHDQFLEILMGQGAPAFVLSTVWLVVLIRKSLPLLVSKEESFAWTLPLILLNLFIGNLAEAMLVCLHHYTGSMFFLTAGYIAALYESHAKAKQSRS